MKNTVSTILILLVGIVAISAQSVRPVDMVNEAKKRKSKFKKVDVFSIVDHNSLKKNLQIEKAVFDYELFDLDASALKSLKSSSAESITLALPSGTKSKAQIDLDLVKVNIFTGDFQVIRASDNRAAEIEHGAFYRGIISGDENSLVAISILGDEVRGFVSSVAGNFVLGKLKGKNTSTHIFYNDKNVIAEHSFECHTPDHNISDEHDKIRSRGNRKMASDDCVRLYSEVDHDIHNNKGGVAGATAYITSMLNEVMTLYANENILTKLSEIKVWDVPSPYNSSSTSGMLEAFEANIDNTNGFNGDLGKLYSYKTSGGIAYVNGLCRSNYDYRLGFSSIRSTFNTVPTYSNSVFVAAHELGHLFGSQHTQACVWNGNNTAIDGCAGSTEGSCALPGLPQNGGTIMSYCNLVSNVGINFNNGFGPQPGNVIRNAVTNASCLVSCEPSCEDGVQNGDETGVDCGGPSCNPCPTCNDGVQNGDETGVDCGGSNCDACGCENGGDQLTLTIVFDNYPADITWKIVDANGSELASAGPYTSSATVSEQICVPEGCYTFTIDDSYGDGLCCAYGAGSYSLTANNGTELASGAVFTSTESTDFCIGDGVDPILGCTDQNAHNYNASATQDDGSCETCDDGQRNGDETGVDCGGSKCSACAVQGCTDPNAHNYNASATQDDGSCQTCNDGIRNGDETGVDCGGSKCDACSVQGCTDPNAHNYNASATQDDGSCETCNDGIQNGDETGVDCGGSKCDACGACENGDDQLTLTIVFDNYPQDITWKIVDAGGAVLASDGPYTSSTTVNEQICVPEGCYTLTIDDSYGDGLCCAYGSGSYSLTAYDGTELASGAVFTSTESTDFCIGDGVDPILGCTDSDAHNYNASATQDDGTCQTCSDGVRNGDETGVDCGGNLCQPCQTGGCTNTVIDYNNFDDSWGIWNDGGSDCRRSANDAAYALSGIPVRLRDNTNTSVMTTDNLDLSNMEEVSIKFSYYPRSMDSPNEDFWLQVSTDGGSSYTTVEEWNTGDEFVNNNWYNDDVTIPGPFTNSTRLRFRCDASSNLDYVYIENVEISGCVRNVSSVNTVSEKANADVSKEAQTNNTSADLTSIRKFTLSPNPVADQLLVEFSIDELSDIDMWILNARGEVIETKRFLSQGGELSYYLDVSNYAGGFYLLNVRTSGEYTSSKFVVVK